jgi:hypothetical protein
MCRISGCEARRRSGTATQDLDRLASGWASSESETGTHETQQITTEFHSCGEGSIGFDRPFSFSFGTQMALVSDSDRLPAMDEMPCISLEFIAFCDFPGLIKLTKRKRPRGDGGVCGGNRQVSIAGRGLMWSPRSPIIGHCSQSWQATSAIPVSGSHQEVCCYGNPRRSVSQRCGVVKGRRNARS